MEAMESGTLHSSTSEEPTSNTPTGASRCRDSNSISNYEEIKLSSCPSVTLPSYWECTNNPEQCLRNVIEKDLPNMRKVPRYAHSSSRIELPSSSSSVDSFDVGSWDEHVDFLFASDEEHAMAQNYAALAEVWKQSTAPVDEAPPSWTKRRWSDDGDDDDDETDASDDGSEPPPKRTKDELNDEELPSNFNYAELEEFMLEIPASMNRRYEEASTTNVELASLLLKLLNFVKLPGAAKLKLNGGGQMKKGVLDRINFLLVKHGMPACPGAFGQVLYNDLFEEWSKHNYEEPNN